MNCDFVERSVKLVEICNRFSGERPDANCSELEMGESLVF